MIAEKDLLVFKCNAFLKPREMHDLYRSIHQQKDTGVIIVPPYIEAILIPEGTEIKISEFVPEKEVQYNFTQNIKGEETMSAEKVKKLLGATRKAMGEMV